MSQPLTLSLLNQLPFDAFVAVLGGIFEHSPWVAERTAALRPFHSVAELAAVMAGEVEKAGYGAQMALIRAHPELAGKAAIRGELTAESSNEQAGAGLDQCSPEEFARLTELNDAYRSKFGFPFILAVRGYDRAGIMREFARRLQLGVEEERRECLEQIYRIGRLRLEALLPESVSV
ncbi:2-oxo-4-hydroxy-4-carboxy-5-ureidoimidazoline decarboxylase [Aquitalea palustris]|uniref:2-oxo-4-hydroxy-4-carboxy-5-ureidoimidazoline decarboxylase n=1 Tax=Aquitalea palustris TaxID=2480983 RepID=A0A454JML5_9NEIS|nr:2-oxo-4-hydroxy-4-carboxy-5-ureidoimidazoline decarboxylase [Aquitalea palustris]RMD01190.1 2-oxo-4-hydroxy-4-carboxy-5-ureidoimidazoline decarboxylase [Aquitalea palustris]